MEVRLPADKLTRIKGLLTTWLDKKKVTKCKILSLVGLLQHAAKVVRCGRSFVSRMYATAARIQELEHFTRLNSDFHSDLWWWQGTRLVKKRALFQCDNMSVVEALKKGSSKDRMVMQLLHSLWFYVAHYDIDFTCVHIMG